MFLSFRPKIESYANTAIIDGWNRYHIYSTHLPPPSHQTFLSLHSGSTDIHCYKGENKNLCTILIEYRLWTKSTSEYSQNWTLDVISICEKLNIQYVLHWFINFSLDITKHWHQWQLIKKLQNNQLIELIFHPLKM